MVFLAIYKRRRGNFSPKRHKFCDMSQCCTLVSENRTNFLFSFDTFANSKGIVIVFLNLHDNFIIYEQLDNVPCPLINFYS
jgi:hypothetical protein